MNTLPLTELPATAPVPGTPAPDLGAELLLRCARSSMDATNATQIQRLLQGELDWARVLQLATRHRIRPLLYRGLQSAAPTAVPEAILTHLQEFFRFNGQRNLVLTGELIQLLTLFERTGIVAIPFKGPVLAHSIYGNLALRESGDLDILVRAEDAERARDALLTQGYRPLDEVEATYSTPEAADRYHFQLLNENGMVLVELHWQFARPYFALSIDHAGLWARAESGSLGGTPIRSFSPEDLLLVLCGHGAKHNWERLSWICDVAELVRFRPALNWRWLADQARTYRCERMLYLGLYLAHDLLGTSLHDAVWSRVEDDPTIKTLATDVRQRLCDEGDGQLHGTDRLSFYAQTREKLRDRLPYFLQTARRKIAHNENDRALLPLPGVLSFFYYVLRPLRLIREYGLSILKDLKGI